MDKETAIDAAAQAVDNALIRAADLLDLTDATDDENSLELYEQRFHCGTCMVRTVMQEVWPSIDSYIKTVVKAYG